MVDDHDSLYATFFHAAPDAVVVVDRGGRIIDCNEAVTTLFGYDRDELLGLRVERLLPASLRGKHASLRLGYMAAPVRRPMGVGRALSGLRRDGTEFPVDVSLAAVDDGGRPVVLAAVRDLTARVHAERELAAADWRFRTVFDDAPLGMAVVGADLRVVQANAALAAIVDVPVEALAGTDVHDLVADGDWSMIDREFGRLVLGGVERLALEVRLRGATRWVSVTVSPLSRAEGRPRSAILMVQDVTERKMEETRLLDLATHDDLSGLANRSQLDDRLRHALARLARTGRTLAVLFVDLDGFKAVNDSFGHTAGDVILREVAVRITQVLRPADTAARVGGDEFVLLCEDLHAAEAEKSTAEIAARVVAAIAEPVDVGNGVARITGSVGAVCTGDAGADPMALIAAADAAMYDAKRRGGGYVACQEWSVRT